MTLDDSSFDNQNNDPPTSEPAWVTRTLHFLPVPIYAFAAAFTAASVSAVSAIVASLAHSSDVWAISGLFGIIAFTIGTASVVRHVYRRSSGSLDSPRYEHTERRPTVAILVFLVSIYSWMLTIGIHLFHTFFAANRPGGMKYYITFGIAVASSLYMQFHGRSLLRAQFGALKGRDIVVSPQQAIVVVLFIFGCSIYFAWIMV